MAPNVMVHHVGSIASGINRNDFISDDFPKNNRKVAGSGDFVIVGQDASSSAVEILKLASLQAPQERNQPYKTEAQCDRDEDDQDIHVTSIPFMPDTLPDLFRVRTERFLTLARSRRLFPITTREDVDMAIAAIRGVIIPAMATGIAIAL